MFKFEYYDEDGVYTSMELRKEFLTHDYVSERFTEFLRSTGYVFDALASHRLVTDEGDVLPNFEERHEALKQFVKDRERDDFIQKSFDEETNEETGYHFPVI